MKKLQIFTMSVVLLLTAFSTGLTAGNEAKTAPVATANPMESAQAKMLINRLEEINAIDKKGMASSEKKELRKEVRAIKRDLNELGGGVYVSVGAIIIILLLLIILL